MSNNASIISLMTTVCAKFSDRLIYSLQLYHSTCCITLPVSYSLEVNVDHFQPKVVVYEEDEEVEFCVVLSQASEKELTVSVNTVDGNATGKFP